MRAISINEVDIDLKGQRTLRVRASMFETHFDIDPEVMEGESRRKRCRGGSGARGTGVGEIWVSNYAEHQRR